MLNLPVDVLTFIIEKSEIIKPMLCIECFRDFGLHYNCIHFDRSEIYTISKFKLVCKYWNKAISHLFKNKQFRFMPFPKFDYSHATIHLIDLKKVDNKKNEAEKDEVEEIKEYREEDGEGEEREKFHIENLDTFTIDLLKKKFPYLIGRLRHGDIIENIAESGYRSEGVIMYYNDGAVEKLVNQNFEYDDYGSPSTEFELFDFTGGYWDKKYSVHNHKLNVNFNTEGPLLNSNFYWHIDYGIASLRRDSLDDAKPIGKISKSGKIHWWMVKKNGRHYLISRNVKRNCDKYAKTYAYCNGWSDEHQAYIIDNEHLSR